MNKGMTQKFFSNKGNNVLLFLIEEILPQDSLLPFDRKFPSSEHNDVGMQRPKIKFDFFKYSLYKINIEINNRPKNDFLRFVFM